MADSFILPGQEAYRDVIARYAVKYPYDPRQSAQLMQSIGYTQGSDGFLHDAAGADQRSAG